jgi:hypothetical protein
MAHSNSVHSINSKPMILLSFVQGERQKNHFKILKIVLKFTTATSILNNAIFGANILLDSTQLNFGQVNKGFQPHAALLKNVYQLPS